MSTKKKSALWLVAAVIPAALAGCTEADTSGATGPQRQISDTAHGSATPGFYWLAPMVPTPTYSGVAVGDASPTVQIDELDGAAARTLATFTVGAGSSSIRYDAAAGSYIVNWSTRAYSLNPALTYRIRAIVPRNGAACVAGTAFGAGCELGFADVDIVSSGNQLRNVQTNEYIALLDGATLAIKFRIERTAVDGDGDGANNWADNCPALSNGDQTDSVGNGVGDACRCAAVTCAAPDACHAAGVCQPATGTCAYANRADGTACNDSDVCNGAETCQAGICAAGTALTTDDHDACTADACDAITGVSHTPVSTDDGNACTADACDPATGVSHAAVSVDDGNACTADACDAITGVSHTPVSVDDNNLCTIDACDAITGVSHAPVSVDDGNACTADACSPATGVSHTPVSVDDGNACTADACSPATGVSHTAVSVDDGNACTADACSPATGVSHTVVSIDDGNACTADACDAITGVSHAPVSADDGDACTADACSPATGVSHTPVSVDDGNACTADACDPVTGAISHTANPVDDGNVCTVDACDTATGLISNTAVATDDGNACTADACDPVTGVSHAAVANGTSCGTGLVCSAGACVAACPAGQRSCGGACVNTQSDTANCGACGNVCGAGNVCSAGACVAGWARGLPGRIMKVARDNATGNLYVLLKIGTSTGSVNSTGPVVLPTGSVTPSCGWSYCPDYVLLALDAAGNGRWHRHVVSTGDDQVGDLALDAAGNVYFSHNYKGSATFPTGPSTTGTLVAETDGVFNTYLLSYDSAGAYRWHRSFVHGGNGGKRTAIATDAAGNVFFGASFTSVSGAVDFGGGPVASPGTSAQDFFVASYNPDGSYRWARRYGPASGNLFTSMVLAADAAGNVYGAATVSGATTASVTMGSLSFTTSGDDLLLWSHDGTGALRYARVVSTTAAEQVREIAVSPTGSPYVLARLAGVVTLLRLDSAGATAASTALSTYDATSVNLDAAGNIFLAGGIGGTVTLLGTTTTGSAYDPTVVSLTSAGALRYIRRGSGPTAGLTDVAVGGGALCTGVVDPSISSTETLAGISLAMGSSTSTSSTGLFCMSSN